MICLSKFVFIMRQDYRLVFSSIQLWAQNGFSAFVRSLLFIHQQGNTWDPIISSIVASLRLFYLVFKAFMYAVVVLRHIASPSYHPFISRHQMFRIIFCTAANLESVFPLNGLS